MNHLRLLEKLAAWRSYGFDRYDVYDEQRRPSSYGHVFLGDDPKHSQIDEDSDCRLPPTPQATTEGMWAELNVLKQELMQPQLLLPQCDVHPRRPFVQSLPPQQCPVPRVVTAEETTTEEERVERMNIFLNALEKRIASVKDGAFNRFERIIKERRGRAAAPVIVAPIDAAFTKPINPQSPCSGISFNVHLCIGERTRGKIEPQEGAQIIIDW